MSQLPPTLTTTHFVAAIPQTPAALDGIARLGALRQAFHPLLAQAPNGRQVIRQLLRAAFAVDPDSSGLLIPRDDGPTLISLTHLSAYTRHHRDAPDPSTAQLAGVWPGRTLAQVYTRLATLDLPQALQAAWAAYWNGRAPGTALSRRQHARDLYKQHFTAALELALARQDVREEQLRPVRAMQASLEGRTPAGLPLLESPSTAPAALVFSIEGEATLVLYRPDRDRAFSVHTDRTALQAQLPASATLVYSPLDDINAGCDNLLEHLSDTLVATLEHDPGARLWPDAEFALAKTDQLALQWRAPEIFAQVSLPTEPGDELNAQPSTLDFGGLGLDIISSTRGRMIDSQLTLLTALHDREPAAPERCNQAVVDARGQARTAIDAQLASSRWHSEAQPVSASEPLVQAHYAGLLAHAQFQFQLKLIKQNELDLIQTLFEHADGDLPADSQVTVSTPVITRADGTEYPLADAMVIGHAATASGDPAPTSLLLYWPGAQGGLLRCDDLAALGHCLGVSSKKAPTLQLETRTTAVMAGLLDHCFKQARDAARTLQNDTGVDALAAALPALKASLDERLQVPLHAARNAAMDLLRQQLDTLALANATPTWLRNMPNATRQAFRAVLGDYIAAMRQAQDVFMRDLPSRSAYCGPRIEQYLKQHFPTYDGTKISLDLPLTTAYVKEPVSGSGAPGVPYKLRLEASKERETLPLEDLLLHNIDEPVRLRLGFLVPVLETQNAELRRTLQTGLTRQYLQDMAKALDLAQGYEDTIRAAYRGIDDREFVQQLRREQLIDPMRQMLRLQSMVLQLRGILDHRGQAVLDIAIDANSKALFQAAGHDIRLHSAVLTSGGADTDYKAVTLSGIVFIEDRASGITLLYLADHPTRPIRQYPSLEAARLGLYEQSKGTGEATYLAGRALVGSPDAHRSRIAQAQTLAFSALIGTGVPWPTTTSLAEHLLDAQMGRVIEAHRATSRSNRDLWLENFAYQSGMVFNYLKMVLGLVPFVGTAIGIYDFFAAAGRAVEALTTGEVIKGIDELENALLCLIDAAIDLSTGVGFSPSAARLATRQRQALQLRPTTTTPLPSNTKAGQRLRRLANYRHDQPLSLQGLQPGTQGHYRGVYRHADGNFILVEGWPIKVQWESGPHTWRPSRKPGQSWTPAVALDEHGHWDTHLALYGVHLKGGGSGGGAALGRLAEQVEPYWPAAIRERLPRFLVDRHYRRQRLLHSQAFAEESKLLANLDSTNTLFEKFEQAETQAQTRMLETLRKACRADIEQAKLTHRSWNDYLPFSAGRSRQVPLTQQSRAAGVVCDRLFNLMELQALEASQGLIQMNLTSTNLASLTDLADQAPLLRRLRNQAIEQLQQRDALFKNMDELEAWYPKAEASTKRQASLERYRQALNAAFRDVFRTHHLMHAAQRYTLTTVIAEYLINSLREAEEETLRMRNTLIDLHEVKPTVQQRRQVHEQARSAFQAHKRRVQSTAATLPALFDETYLKLLLENLDMLIARVDRKIQRLPGQALAPRIHNTSPRLFLTTDDKLHVGDFTPATRTTAAAMVMRDEAGNTLARFEQANNQRWQIDRPAVPLKPNELKKLREMANEMLSGLTAYRERVQGYQRQGMLPVDIEHMMHIKAEDLEGYATRLHQLEPGSTLASRLRSEAVQLRSRGTALRVEQLKQSKTPNEGYLDYLLGQGQVSLLRIGERKPLKERDYLQEYAVMDTAVSPERPLWYAHFHYTAHDTAFDRFNAAHLKLAAERYHGPQWQPQQDADVWRGPIGKQLAKLHFAPLQ